MRKEELKEENETNKKEPSWDSLAMDIAGKLKAAEKAKDLAIVVLGIAIIAVAVSLSVINYRNDCEWRELLSTHDCVSQDGNVINGLED